VIDGEPGAVVNDILSTPTEYSRPVPLSTATAWQLPSGTPLTASTGGRAQPGPDLFRRRRPCDHLAGGHRHHRELGRGRRGHIGLAGRRWRAHRLDLAAGLVDIAGRLSWSQTSQSFPSTTSRRTAREPRLCGHRSGRLVVRGRRQPRTPAPLAVHQRPGMVGCGPPGGGRPRHRLAPRLGRGRRSHDRTGRQPPGPAYVLVRQNGDWHEPSGPPSSAALSPRLGRPVSSAMTANS